MEFNQQRVLKRLEEMIKIDSPSYKESHMTDYLQKYFEERGLEVYRDQAGKIIGNDNSGNLIVYIPGTLDGEAICFNAHQDTVEPGHSIEPIFENGILTSKGNTILAADDKSGIAMMMECLELIKETNTPHRNMYFLFTICEENGMLGAKNLDYSKLPVKNICVLDGASKLGGITKSGAGKDTMKITFHGKMAHGGIEPEKGINAIAVAASAINRIQFGRISADTTSNIGHIEGGGATNIVPDKVTFTCEVRSHTQQQIQEQVNLIREACKDAAKEFGATVDIDIDHFCPVYKPNLDSYMTKVMIKALEMEGITPHIKISNGSGDGNIFASYGYDCASVSTGMYSVHTTDEYLVMEDFAKALNIVWRLMTETLI